jgi:hypothetical protein
MTQEVLVSTLTGNAPETVAMRDHVIYCARNPNPGSVFDLATRDIRKWPDSALFAKLIRRRYNGLVFWENGQVVGHAIWQRRLRKLRIFSLYGHVLLRGQGRGTAQVAAWLRFAHKHRFKTLVIGAGGNEMVKGVWQRAVNNDLGLPFNVRAGREPYSVSIEYETAFARLLHFLGRMWRWSI